MDRYALPTHVTVYGSNAAKESRMGVERTSTASSLVEVLDRVLEEKSPWTAAESHD